MAMARGDSYYKLSLQFHKLIEEARLLPDFLVRGAQDHITRLEMMGEDKPKIWRIFHTIPRGMLQSLVLGTVAYDFSRKADRPETYQELSGWGVYVVSVGVAGREGAWLTARELLRLVRHLQTYLRAFEAYHAHGGAPRDVEELRLQDFAATIDNTWGRHESKCPRFVDKEERLPGWRLFADQLQARANASLAIDPTGHTRLIQAPLYVGCSTQMEVRCEKYDPARGNATALKSVSKSYGLLMSLMSYMNRPPVHVCKCVLRLWKRDEVPIAEVLVGALASCYISQDGLNRETCGGESGLPRQSRQPGGASRGRPSALVDEVEADSSDEEDMKLHDAPTEEYVKARESFMYDNITASEADLTARLEFVQDFVGVQDALEQPDGNLLDRLRQAREQIADLEDLAVQMRLLRDQCERKKKELEAEAASFDSNAELFGLIHRLSTKLIQHE